MPPAKSGSGGLFSGGQSGIENRATRCGEADVLILAKRADAFRLLIFAGRIAPHSASGFREKP
jgi:hypothetical protein